MAGIDISKSYWLPERSAVWIHLQALAGILGGHAAYPSYARAGDIATGVPPITTIDFWWVYALDKGTNPILVAVVVGLLLVTAVWLALRLAAEISHPPAQARNRGASRIWRRGRDSNPR